MHLRLISVLLVALLIFRASTSRAEIVLSNLADPSGGFGLGIGTTNPPSSANTMLGQEFRTGSDPRGYRLNSVTLSIGGSTGTGLGDFMLELYGTIQFGTASAQFGDFLVTSNPNFADRYTFEFTDRHLVLAPTTQYTIVASSPDSTGPTVSQYGWRLVNFPSVVSGPGWLFGGSWSSANNGATWTPMRSPPLPFAIDATTIPEPTSLALVSFLAFVQLCFYPRRRPDLQTNAATSACSPLPEGIMFLTDQGSFQGRREPVSASPKINCPREEANY